MFQSGNSGLRRASRVGALALPITLFAGCVHQSADGMDVTFRYELWVPLVAFLVGIVAAPVGWAIRQRIRRLGWIMVVAGPFVATCVAPSVLRDQVSLDRDGFRIRSGFWGTDSQEVRYDQVRALKIVAETRYTRKGKKTDTYFLCEMKAGEPVKVGVNNDLTKAAAPTILIQAMARGIAIEGLDTH